MSRTFGNLDLAVVLDAQLVLPPPAERMRRKHINLAPALGIFSKLVALGAE